VVLPTFVVIGAMKAGTVSLHHYLGEHRAHYSWPAVEPWRRAGGGGCR
jgi:hypothetical protein